MSSNRKKVIALSLGKAAAQVIGILVAMAMARLLTKPEVAAYRQTLLAYATLAPLLGLGIHQGIYYFLPVEKVRIRGRVIDGLTLLACTGFLFATFILLGGNQLLAQRFSNPQVASLLLWMIPYAIFTTPSTITESVLVARELTNKAAIFGVCSKLFIGISTIIPLLVWDRVEAPLIGNVVASVMMALISLRLMWHATPADSSLPDSRQMKEMLAFAIPLGLAGMIGMLFRQTDKVIVSAMCGPEEFAVFSFGAMEIPVIVIFTGAITSVLLPQIRKAIVDEKLGEAVRLFKVTSEKAGIFILPLSAFFLSMPRRSLFCSSPVNTNKVTEFFDGTFCCFLSRRCSLVRC